jgi:NADPH2:quinone reductase
MRILIEMRAIGEFCRCVPTKGNYHLKKPRSLLVTGAGVVVDSNNTEFKVGDRIAFADVPCQFKLVAVPVEHVIPLPDALVSETPPFFFKGINRSLSATDSHKTQKEAVLIHFGGRSILTQISKLLGATVIGLTSSVSKTRNALKNGADKVFLF